MQQSDAMSESLGQQIPEQQPRNVFFTGLCAGAMVGAGVALLFTPRTGSEVRERLADSAARAAAAVSSTVEALAHRGDDIAAHANGGVSQSGEDLARAAELGRTHGKGLATLGEMAALHGEDWRLALRS